MRELAILTFVTLDGVMQAPADASEDRSGGFRNAGWERPFWEPVMEQVGREAMAEPYDLLLGRNTYDVFETVHTAGDVDETRPESAMDRARKHIVTSSDKPLLWQNASPVTGDIPAEIARLKAGPGPLLQVHGSWQLIQLLQAHDLIDEFRLWVFPVVLGAGKRLFADGARRSDLSLVRSEPTGNGVVMQIYRRAH